MNWRQQGACLSADPETFFAEYPARGFTFDAELEVFKAQNETAKSICAGCPVRVECLEEALDIGEEFGIRGGMDPAERAALLERATVA